MWRGTSIKTGDRTIKIKLQRNIPQSFSTMQGKVKVTVRYKDQPQTCFECGLPGHEKRDCPKTQSYASKVLVAQPQPEPEQAEEPASETNSNQESIIMDEESTDCETRRKEKKDKKERKERKEKRERKKITEPAMACNPDGKRKDAPSPEGKSTPTPAGRHALPQAIPVYKIRKQ